MTPVETTNQTGGLSIGGPAPDFTLRDQFGQDVTLSSYRGKKAVALIFYPFAFSGVCTGEMAGIRSRLAEFLTFDSEVLAISCDTAPSQKLWAEQQGFTFPVLSDFWPHGEVSKSYGAFNDALGCANRVTVVVGKDGTIVDRFDTPDLKTARTSDRYAEALTKL